MPRASKFRPSIAFTRHCSIESMYLPLYTILNFAIVPREAAIRQSLIRTTSLPHQSILCRRQTLRSLELGFTLPKDHGSFSSERKLSHDPSEGSSAHAPVGCSRKNQTYITHSLPSSTFLPKVSTSASSPTPPHVLSAHHSHLATHAPVERVSGSVGHIASLLPIQ